MHFIETLDFGVKQQNKCKKLSSLKHGVRSQITRLKLQKSILGFSYRHQASNTDAQKIKNYLSHYNCVIWLLSPCFKLLSYLHVFYIKLNKEKSGDSHRCGDEG